MICPTYRSTTRHPKTTAHQFVVLHIFGLAGNNTPGFVDEHLTLSNKFLHAAASKKAREMSYAFVWVRNGGICTKRRDASGVTD